MTSMTNGENMSDRTACERFERCLDAYLGDALASREREAVRRHASSCPACLAKLTGDDPLAVFLPLSQQAPSDRVTDGFWEAVRAGIERQSAGARTADRARQGAIGVFGGRPMAAFALAASLLVMVLAAWLVGRIAPAPISGRSPLSPMVVAERARSAAPLPQTVEQVRTDDARDVQIYSMTWLDRDPADPGRDPGQVTELILIVDAGLKL